MKKKIKNLTYKDMEYICDNCDGCKCCPLNIPDTDKCIRGLMVNGALKEKLNQKVEVKEYKKEIIIIEDMFKSINNNKKVFNKKGFFIENTYEKYAQKVADKFFNGNIDVLDKICEEEHCFKEIEVKENEK